MINSVPAIQEKMDRVFTMAQKFNAEVIGLAMNKEGIPKDAEKPSCFSYGTGVIVTPTVFPLISYTLTPWHYLVT